MSLRFGPDGKPNGPGRFPHLRIKPTPPRVDPHAKAPPGLPKNFYDNDWYQSLDQIERRKLDAQEAVDLSFPKMIIWSVLHLSIHIASNQASSVLQNASNMSDCKLIARCHLEIQP
ncbi:hypothetical protein P691DRAFT_680679 [Macrolepiota fuliginosa MF-IS2]|uniref:Uncharacterized protein n=1 Tax=Macrolepiota fuliginosa MF-IS2 TaxID=1400762 RepID=A0A9P5X126_9AGAR|nr:hypothetical protein P691DRAFT_680679 [Macrolepiota fuliginosa MF-IS2]